MSTKKHNILLLTSEYPNPDSSYDTPIIHYFTKEWVKLGVQVQVIHYRSIFPAPFYWIAFLFRKQVKRFFGTDFIPSKRRKKVIHYELDGVSVASVPIFKIFPHIRYSKSILNKQINSIIKTNKNLQFSPDFIIGHFYNPQLPIVSALKSIYPCAKTCIVLHEHPLIIKRKFLKSYQSYFVNIDIWGFRFKKLKDDFEKEFGTNFKTFICYSGVPEEFIFNKISTKKFDDGITRFCFVGMLIPLKRVSDIIIALNISFPNKNFKLEIVGVGMELDNLKQLTADLNLDNNIIFLGKKSRDEVQKILDTTQCFVMVSESEAFGLVYLEAMSKGCITIGTKGQGIDGVIENGKNGFLCESKNIEELVSIFKQIKSLESSELKIISQNAIDTSVKMTDKNIAQSYLSNLIHL
jgi:glycosyltransferase involved in cell wall biosynthesis